MTQNPSVFTSGESDEDKLGRFIGGSSVSVVSSFVAGLFALGWAALMTRVLGKDDYAIVGPYMQAFWILSTLVSMGVPHTLVTFISHNVETDFDAACDIARQGTRLLLFFALGFCIPAVAAIVFMHFTGVADLYVWLCAIMIVCVFTRQMFFSNYATLAGLQRMDLLSLSNIVFSISLPFLSLGYIVLARAMAPGDSRFEVLAGVGGIGTASLMSYLVSFLIVNKTRLPARMLLSFRGRLTRGREILTFGWVANVALMGNTVVGLMPPIYTSYAMAQGLRWYGPTLAANKIQAGIFSCAFTYAMAPMLVMGLTFALIPAMSEAEAQGNKTLLNRYFNTSVKYCFSICAMLTAIYAVVIGQFVHFFTGGEYAVAAVHSLTLVLESGMAAAALFFLFLSMLIGLKRPAVAAKTVVFVILLEVAAMTLAGRFTGDLVITAAAVAVSLAVGDAILLYYLITQARLRMDWGLFFPPVVSALAVWAACRAAMPEGILGFFVACFLGIPLFFLVDGLLGGISRSDLVTVRSTLQSLRLGFLTSLVDLAERIFNLSPFYHKEAKPS